jgi:hypothetical protein
MKILNVASAGFVLTIGDTSILMDPWLMGRGFYEGWEPLYAANIKCISKEIEYIWFSHEHPDHFHPKSVKLLESHFYKLPTVIFQYTLNKRVKKYLEKRGFQVIEVKDKPIILCSGVALRVVQNGLYDSAIQIRNENYCFTHLNDTSLTTHQDLASFKLFAGNRFHVATSQYSVAHSSCAINDTSCWEKNIILKKQHFKNQMITLKPNVIIPSSSAVHFCADDNQYMNQNRTNPKIFLNDIDLSFATVVLPLPEFEWKVDDLYLVKDINKKATSVLDELLQNTSHKITVRSRKGSFELMSQAMGDASKKIRRENNLLLLWIANRLGFLSTINFYLTDLNQFAKFSLYSGLVKLISEPVKFVKINSEVLTQVYCSPYGGDSLIASGRYDLNGCLLMDLSNHLSIIHLNTAGIYLRFSLTFNRFMIMKFYNALVSYIKFFQRTGRV